MATPSEDVVGKLNSFLRGEISAVETYKQALDKVKDPAVRSQLESCEQDHEQRVQLLRDRITELGGKPDTSSGAWGIWAKLVEGGGALLGEKTALQALEEGEDHGLNDYRRGPRRARRGDPELGGEQSPSQGRADPRRPEHAQAHGPLSRSHCPPRPHGRGVRRRPRSPAAARARGGTGGRRLGHQGPEPRGDVADLRAVLRLRRRSADVDEGPEVVHQLHRRRALPLVVAPARSGLERTAERVALLEQRLELGQRARLRVRLVGVVGGLLGAKLLHLVRGQLGALGDAQGLGQPAGEVHAAHAHRPLAGELEGHLERRVRAVLHPEVAEQHLAELHVLLGLVATRPGR